MTHPQLLANLVSVVTGTIISCFVSADTQAFKQDVIYNGQPQEVALTKSSSVTFLILSYIMLFPLSTCQLVLATALFSTCLLAAMAEEPHSKETTTFETLHAKKTAGIYPRGLPTGSGQVYPSGTGSGFAVPTGSTLEFFVYENGDQSLGETGPTGVPVSIPKIPSIPEDKGEDPMLGS